MLVFGVFAYILSEASTSLLVQRIRACEGLSEWNEQRYGSHAKYKGVVDNLIGSMLEGETSSESCKFDVNMFNIAIGFGF